MHITLTALPAVALLVGLLPAQQVALTEHFSAGVPPAGWSQVRNNPQSGGWLQSTAGEAWHEDEAASVGACDDELISPVLDLRTFGSVYAHFETRLAFANYLANHPNSLGDGENDLYVRVNGGAWTEVWTDVRTVNSTDPITVDLTAAAAGQSQVEFAFRYYGTFAQEWWIDFVQVSDSATPPTFGTFLDLNLPSATIRANGTCDGFESYGGSLPPHMATTVRNSSSGLPDPQGWATIAGGTYPAYAGVRNLELGLAPGVTNYHDVTTALVIGFDGRGTSDLQLDFRVVDHGEETHALDGVWLSTDGVEWFRVYGPWTPLPAAWTAVHLDLSSYGALTGGYFYLAFVQEDNFPYANLDGIGVDEVCLGDPPPPPFTLSVSGTCPGAITLDAANATPGRSLLILYGGPGTFVQSNPNQACYGLTLGIATPSLGAVIGADGAGAASLTFNAPGAACGFTVQSVDLGSCRASNTVVL
jgi:hypothetical protein